jgi:hypothetical protein
MGGAAGASGSGLGIAHGGHRGAENARTRESGRTPGNGGGLPALRHGMAEVWITFALLNADLLVLASRRVGWPWPWLYCAAPMARRAVERQRQPDLLALGLDRMPSSWDGLRRAYRAAAKAAHPDTGGSADAFRAVSEAFERLARRLHPEAA